MATRDCATSTGVGRRRVASPRPTTGKSANANAIVCALGCAALWRTTGSLVFGWKRVKIHVPLTCLLETILQLRVAARRQSTVRLQRTATGSTSVRLTWVIVGLKTSP